MCARSALSQPCLQHLIACMCMRAGMQLCDGRYLNWVQQGVSEVSPPACSNTIRHFVVDIHAWCCLVCLPQMSNYEF